MMEIMKIKDIEDVFIRNLIKAKEKELLLSFPNIEKEVAEITVLDMYQEWTNDYIQDELASEMTLRAYCLARRIGYTKQGISKYKGKLKAVVS